MSKKQTVSFWIAILCFAGQYMYGQTIQGNVIDKSTKEPIIGANITTQDHSSGTISDDEGRFTIKHNNQSLIISYIGYKQIQIYPDKPVITVELEKDNIQLDEVTLTAKSKAREIKETSMPVVVIDIKDIQGTVSNIQEVLAKTSGITIRSNGGIGSTAKISLRGLEGKRIGYFINSKSMSDNTDFLDINDIPIDLIERIEIYKGIVPGRLGGNAMGGAINIITKGYPNQNIDLSYSLGSFNTHRIGAIAKFNTTDDAYEYGFGGFYTSSDNNYKMELPLQKGKFVTRENDGFHKILLGGGFSSKKWYFDEIEVKPLFVQSKKEIQGIENRISEAFSYSNLYALSLSNMAKKDFLIEELDFNLSGIYSYATFGLVDKATQRQNWDGSYYPAVTSQGG